MIQLLILCLTSAMALAVSSPEIVTKSVKVSSPQQQQIAHKPSSPHDDPMLNAINAYAQQYDTTAAPGKTSQYNQQIYSQQYTPSNSYKLPSSPTIESNFQPMPAPHQQQPHSLTTPVIMQYLPQSPQLSDGGVQYLQLIPTRPLLVPISPYVPPMAQAYQAPQIVPTQNDIPARPDSVSSVPYGGLQSYANTLQNYRSYRINREIKPSNIPDDMSLNLNEYMPSSSDVSKPASMIRGRP